MKFVGRICTTLDRFHVLNTIFCSFFLDFRLAFAQNMQEISPCYQFKVGKIVYRNSPVPVSCVLICCCWAGSRIACQLPSRQSGAQDQSMGSSLIGGWPSGWPTIWLGNQCSPVVPPVCLSRPRADQFLSSDQSRLLLAPELAIGIARVWGKLQGSGEASLGLRLV